MSDSAARGTLSPAGSDLSTYADIGDWVNFYPRMRVTLRWRRFLRRTATGSILRLRESLRLRRLRVFDACFIDSPGCMRDLRCCFPWRPPARLGHPLRLG